MLVVETVKVKASTGSGFLKINRVDFDPSIHEKFEETPKATKPETSSSGDEEPKKEDAVPSRSRRPRSGG